jgi:sugar lactone lactonase YvrE
LTLTGGGQVTVLALQLASADFNPNVVTTTFNSIAGSVWLGNPGSLSTLDLNGALISPTTGFKGSGLTTPAGPQSMAFDASGNLWVANAGSAGISKFAMNGTPAIANPYTTGINSPASLVIDGSSRAFVVNHDGTITLIAVDGTATSLLSDAPIPGPSAAAIDSSGNLWIANATTNKVEEYIGMAAPAAPLAAAVKTNTVGTKP